MKKPLQINDYVLVSRWADADPNDPWAVGFLDCIKKIGTKDYYSIEGNNRLFQHCKRITKKRGEKILLEYPMKSLFGIKNKLK